MKKYISIIIMGLILFSCELIVDITVPFKRQQLTINSFFSPDSVWSATISLNRYILNDSTAFQRVEDAFVVIYDGEAPVDTLNHIKNGIYKSDTGKPKIGIEYEIRASAANYESVSGRSKIPSPAQITNIEITPDSRGTVTTFNFHDNPAEINFYQIFAEFEYESYNEAIGKVVTRRSKLFDIEIDNPTEIKEINSLINDNSFESNILLKDVLFNGKEGNVSFRVNYYYGNAKVIIYLRTLSEDYYKYETTTQLQNKVMGDPFAQPVNVYNDIKNGFGVFGGYSQSTYIRSNPTPRPVITGINPLKGRPGDHVTIIGENLLDGSVSFTGTIQGHTFMTSATRVRSTKNEIEVIIPDNSITGKIIFSRGGKVAVSDVDFEVID